jgi:hypothetical protein
MTNFSGGAGPQFDGNSVVIEDRDDNPRLIIIHRDRIEAVPLSATVALHSSMVNLVGSRVIAYSSPVGNNFVPYPTVFLRSASDDLLLYLVLEGVFIRVPPNLGLSSDLLYDGPYQLWYCFDRGCSNGKLVGWGEYCDCTKYCLRARNGSEALRKSAALVGDSAKVEVTTLWEHQRPVLAAAAEEEVAPAPREDGLIVQNIYTMVRAIDISSDESSDEVLSEDESESDNPPAAEP